jgi:type I restriction enzyme S subunit
MTLFTAKKLSELLELSIGGIWGEELGKSEVDVSVVRVTELKAHGRLDPSTSAKRSVTQKQLASRELKEGDLLLEKSGGGPNSPVGRVGYYFSDGTRTVCSNFMQLMRPNLKLVTPKYLFYFLDGFHSNGGTIPMQTATTNIRNIKTPQYMNIEVPLPPLPEQQKIVEILEDHLSRLDAALADVKQAKLKAAQFRRSLLQSIFKGQYSANSDVWARRTIGDFAEVKGGKRLPKGTQWSDKSTLHPYIRATDIKFGKIKTEDLVYVPDSVWKSISKYVVAENDVVITIAGTIGEIAVVP